MVEPRELRLRLYVSAVAAAAVATSVTALLAAPIRLSPILVAIAFFAMISETLAVELPQGGALSITYPLTLAALVCYGPTAGAFVAGISYVPILAALREKRVLKPLFNISQYLLTAVLSGWCYYSLGGWRLSDRPLTTANFLDFGLPLLGLIATYFFTNLLLVSIVISLSTGASIRRLLASNFSWSIPTELSLSIVGVVLAQVVVSEGVLALVLFAVPLLVARQLYERYVTLRDAYADTVRGLVAAIEAKDPYTAGHSERVTTYSCSIARELALDERRVERLELCALLHDLGKIGISRRILGKPGPLTADERAAIENHPELGARIIEPVSFLEDIVPVIVSHHERVDGRGYCKGLSGDGIPLDARILAVADSFDAMTSSRPYRRALNLDEATRELRDGCDRQFDHEAVQALLRVLARDSSQLESTIGETADEAV